MMISASRRTDIPAFYAPWFANRLRTGHVLVRNPLRHHQVSRVSLLPQHVDFIAFWTKNPSPMLPFSAELSAFDYGFQYTITGYGPLLEPNVPDLATSISLFRRLAELLGPDRVVWRYDPIVLHRQWTPEAHKSQFARIACALAGSTHRCVISFLDAYPSGAAALRRAGISVPGEAAIMDLAPFLADTADRCGMTVETCAEAYDLSRFGILPGGCLNPAFTGIATTAKDRNQRPGCRCQPSVDIGAYHSCPHLCVYCYANHGQGRVATNMQRHQPDSPFLLGGGEPGDVIRDRCASAANPEM